MSKDEFYKKYFDKEQLDLVIGILEFGKIAQETMVKDAEGIDDDSVRECVRQTKEGAILNKSALVFYTNLRDKV